MERIEPKWCKSRQDRGFIEGLMSAIRKEDKLQTKKKPLAFAKGFNMAGAERLELATPGFGDRCSTN